VIDVDIRNSAAFQQAILARGPYPMDKRSRSSCLLPIWRNCRPLARSGIPFESVARTSAVDGGHCAERAGDGGKRLPD
jgi:hypothetical protein